MVGKIHKNTVTTSLNDAEYNELTKLCLVLGMSEDALLRNSFRYYHDMHRRINRGEELKWFNEDGNQTWPLVVQKKAD